MPVMIPNSCKASADRRGLSLGEMLVVIAVFAILAAVLVISSTQVMVNTRVSRVKQEQNTLANACRRFRMDYQNLPNGLELLSANARYIEKAPSDPFLPDAKTPYVYYTYPNIPGEQQRFAIIVSRGPDGDVDFSPNIAASAGAGSGGGIAGPDVDSAEFRNRLSNFITSSSYDPTNGARSGGDIIYVIDSN